MERDIGAELQDMHNRYMAFDQKVANILSNDLQNRLLKIGNKIEALDRKWKTNVKFDPETKMWKISMDNKVAEDIKKEKAELQKDAAEFAKKVDDELANLGQDLSKDFQEIGQEMEEAAQMLEDPKFKAELEALAQKMKALELKIKNGVKFEE